MKIYLATDHGGFELKEKIKEYLNRKGYEVEDCGAYDHDKLDDYPDFISKAAEAVSKNPEVDKAIILGSSGQGEAIVANKFKGIRAAVFYGGAEDIISLSREHNNANVLSLGAKFLTGDEVIRVVQFWLDTPFENVERHIRRIEKIKAIEDKI